MIFDASGTPFRVQIQEIIQPGVVVAIAPRPRAIGYNPFRIWICDALKPQSFKALGLRRLSDPRRFEFRPMSILLKDSHRVPWNVCAPQRPRRPLPEELQAANRAALRRGLLDRNPAEPRRSSELRPVSWLVYYREFRSSATYIFTECTTGRSVLQAKPSPRRRGRATPR